MSCLQFIATKKLKGKQLPARKNFWLGLQRICIDGFSGLREDKWKKSTAVGSRRFVARVRSIEGILAKGKQSIGAEGVYHLREPSIL